MVRENGCESPGWEKEVIRRDAFPGRSKDQGARGRAKRQQGPESFPSSGSSWHCSGRVYVFPLLSSCGGMYPSR